MHYIEDINSDFTKRIKKGDIIVANKNFGCGLSREHAPITTKESGISYMIASTSVGMFYRNAINIRLLIIECEEAVEPIDTGDELEIGSTAGIMNNKLKKQECKDEPFPEFVQKIINSNKLVSYIKSEEVKSEEGES